MDSLVVDLNSDGPHAIDVAASSFRTSGAFEIVLDNHGAALHVYLQLDDDLAAAAQLSAANHFVEEGSLRRVSVDVDESRAPVRGRLKIVTGYGAETEFVTVSVEEVDEAAAGVDVDESLSRPRPRPAPDDEDPLLDPSDLPALGLVALAVVVAGFAAVSVGGGLAVLALLGALIAVAVAGALISR